MNTHQPAFVLVDMRGLKAALVERAQVERVNVSVLVRRAVARELSVGDAPVQAKPDGPQRFAPDVATVKLSIRLTTDEADRLVAGAQSVGLSRGAYLAGLVAGVPALNSGVNRTDQIAALAETNAHLSSLSRNVHALTWFLTLGDVPQALVYRDMLNRLDGDVRRHLTQATALLADLRPRGHTAETRHGSNR